MWPDEILVWVNIYRWERDKKSNLDMFHLETTLGQTALGMYQGFKKRIPQRLMK